MQADALNDLRTSSNELSVWYIEDDESNLEHVITALAASGDTVANLDYALFDLQLITNSDIKIHQSPGITPDERVNALWHRDLIELSASKIMRLATIIFTQAEMVLQEFAGSHLFVTLARTYPCVRTSRK